MERIRIELERSGGFGGLTLHSVLDTEDLPPEERRELAGLVDAVEGSHPPPEPPARVPDAMRYELTIRRGGRVSQLSFVDPTVPAEVRSLFDRVTRPGRGD